MRHAMALGLQGKQTVQQGCAWGLDMEEQTFVQALQGAGWSTHMVGKAHIGADHWRRTPTFRGFNTFAGYLYGAEDYFSHELAGYYDLRNDTQPRCGANCSVNIGAAHAGTYSTPLLAAEVVRLVAAAGRSAAAPTYIHFTPQSVHAPLQAPEEYVAPYRPIFGPDNAARAIHAGASAECLREECAGPRAGPLPPHLSLVHPSAAAPSRAARRARARAQTPRAPCGTRRRRRRPAQPPRRGPRSPRSGSCCARS
jgi:arylsulfatase A-like enzyme